jgi:2'-hydroxyisoflavone reductase
MKILILGGSQFVGRHIVEHAVTAGHQITILNRGLHNAELFPALEKLRGDRDVDLSALQGRQFDAVIDTCCYRPQQMQAVFAALGKDVPFYLFISTISVYADFPAQQIYSEDSPLLQGESGYGAAKARCEEVIEAHWPGRVAHVRPGLIVGPHDPSGRFTYWPRRIAQGGDVLAPGNPDNAVQWIDVRDLAAWCIHLCANQITGHFHAVGPQQKCSFASLLAACRNVSHSDAHLHWLSDADLLAAGVEPWRELPLWLPQQQGMAGMMWAANQRALAAGLELRPVEETIAATLAWDADLSSHMSKQQHQAKTLSADREAALLQQIKGRLQLA